MGIVISCILRDITSNFKQHMLKTKLFLVLILLSNIAVCQVKDYKGIVFDIFDNKLGDVAVTNLRTKETVTTDCKGRFLIRSNKGDSIAFMKENYLFHLQKISGNKKMRILLNFDILQIKKKVFETQRYNRNIIFIVDGEVNHKYKDKRISPFEKTVIRGRRMDRLFGEEMSHAVIFIATNCDSKLESSD